MALQGKYGWVKGLAEEDAAWLAELPFTLSVPSRRIIVAHAGLLPGVPLDKQSLNDIYTVGLHTRTVTPEATHVDHLVAQCVWSSSALRRKRWER